jgi:6-phosphofructo-2-kinase/fructose-2,6-biphosphatase 2
MVGLPARGKTYIARKLCRYLTWLGIPTRVFNVGNYRRHHFGARQTHDFFDSHNEAAREQRRQAALEALHDMSDWFASNGEARDADRNAHKDAEPGNHGNFEAETIATDDSHSAAARTQMVAIYDATNTTADRRRMIKEHCDAHSIATLFIESVCDDPQLILANIREVKLSSPDYEGCADEAQAIADFTLRIRHYEQVYEPLGETDTDPAEGSSAAAAEAAYSYVKLINVKERVVINNVHDYLQSRIVFLLINLHIGPRSIYLVRHGESQHNREGRIGGDAALSESGEAFARALPALLSAHVQPQSAAALQVWTSTLRRTIQTASHLARQTTPLKALDELDAGVCDGLTYAEIAERFPEDFAARDADKFTYRYRGGESYADLVHRIEPVIMELERQGDVLIIAHQAVLRVILAYFLDKPLAQLPYIPVPLHTLIKLTPKAYECFVECFPLTHEIPAVDTFRPKPSSNPQ